MILEVELGKKKITIDSTMNVEQYQRIQVNKLFLDNPNPSKLLSVYLDVKESEIKNAPKDQVEFIEKIIFSRLTEGVTKDMIFTFDYEGVTYGFENDWKKLAWGAWQDLEFLSSEDITANIHKILAVLYRPVTEMKDTKYKIEPYDSNTTEERAENFKKIPVKIWFGSAQVFFFISSTYISNIKNTMESQMKFHRLMEKGVKIFPKWLRKRLRLDSILARHLNSVKTI
jgi:hypothetical protein